MSEMKASGESLPDFALVVSSSSGGGGKTLFSLGLARALVRKGFTVRAFKKGPDYIDAAWLARAAQSEATNLDSFFLDRSRLRALFFASCTQSSGETKPLFALIEGNRGLYDGLDLDGSCSTAELSRTLSAPVVLTLDCTKMTRTAAALVQGLVHFEENVQIAGLILNRVGTARQAELLRSVFETYTDVPVLGILPRISSNPLPERHMGIACAGDRLSADAEERLEKLADHVLKNVDLEHICQLCRYSPKEKPSSVSARTAHRFRKARPRIGFVRDASFWFYYKENLEALREQGAELVPIALLGEKAAKNLRGIHGLYIGGGFPEDYAQFIARSPLLKEIAGLARAGLPIYAECGGFMLLARSLFVHGQKVPMAGIFPVDVEFCAKPQGLGYTEGHISLDTPFYPKGMTLKGHEFHYSRVIWKGTVPPFALTLSRGCGMKKGDGMAFDGLVLQNVWASYTHIFAPAVPLWAESFVALSENYLQRTSPPSA